MNSHASVAARVRLEKEQYPNRFCTQLGCLWRTQTRSGFKPCPKHHISWGTVVALSKLC
jgi:hypothetical protein